MLFLMKAFDCKFAASQFAVLLINLNMVSLTNLTNKNKDAKSLFIYKF